MVAQFFLGISFCRHGGYEKSRSYFAKNAWIAKNQPEHLFYSNQGLAFYHYFCANFEKSRHHVERSLSASTNQDFTYGRALASDLLGHTLIQLGQVANGLTKLEAAENLARQIGDGGLAHSIRLSILSYRAQHGYDSRTAVKSLREAYDSLDPQNTHARSGLLLEMANQQLLQGNLQAASQSLEEASKWIYQSQHRRFNYVLSLRLAELSFHSGQYAKALHAVQNVRTLLDPKHDRLNLLMALGLELKLLRALEMHAPAVLIREQLIRLTSKTKRAISTGMVDRTNGSALMGEDLIAALFSGIEKENDEETKTRVIESGYLSLLYRSFSLDRKKKILAFHVLGKDCAIFDRGEVFYNREAYPKQLYRLLMLLAEGEKSKAELTQLLWGYDYHPLRHDGLIYQSVSRLRMLLGTYAKWIESSDTGYRLPEDVEVVTFFEPDESKEPKAKVRLPQKEPFALDHLNQRQLTILEMFKKKPILGVPDLKKLKVSEMTLRRDFTQLLNLDLITRVGKARSTRYRLQNTAKLDTQGP